MAERQSYHTDRRLSREQVARLLYQAGFRGDAIWKLVAIAGRESSYDPGAHGTDQPRSANSGDRGLFQINSTHDDTLRANGIDPAKLFDPATNARAAYVLSNGGDENSLLQLWGADQSGWVGARGNYLFGTDPMAAQAAYNQVAQAGWPPVRGGAAGQGQGPPSMGDIAQGLGNLGAPGYGQYATDPRRQIDSRYQAIMAAMGGGSPGQGIEQFNWQEHPELNDQYNQLSPHLQAFERWTTKNYGGTVAGDYEERSITGGGPPSSHAFGAAFDWKPTSRDEGLSLVQKVIENPSAFGIQAVHDYEGGRIWHADRAAEGGSVEAGWKPYDFPPGDASDTHFHFEVDRNSWDDHGRQVWRSMNQAQRGTYRQDGQTLTPQQFANVAERKGNRGNPLFEDYATIGAQQLARRQARWGARQSGGPGQTNGPANQALSNLLENIGVDYPTQHVTPTPALLAYLNGVGLDLSTAEDLRRTALQRIRVGATDARQAIRRNAVLGKEGVTGDLIRRGMLSSGEANTRYTRQARDVAEQKSDLATQTAQSREDAVFAYDQSTDAIRRAALEQITGVEEQQRTTRATNRATARGARRATRVQNRVYQRQQQAQETANQQLIDLINSLYPGGTRAPRVPSAPTAPTYYPGPGGTRRY